MYSVTNIKHAGKRISRTIGQKLPKKSPLARRRAASISEVRSDIIIRR